MLLLSLVSARPVDQVGIWCLKVCGTSVGAELTLKERLDTASLSAGVSMLDLAGAQESM